MAKGTMCALVCPALEDELIFGMLGDPEPKNVYLVDNESTETIVPKLKTAGIAYTNIAEKDIITTAMDLPKDVFNIVILMCPMRLHKVPEDLRNYLQDTVHTYHVVFDSVVLYYGMCGNYDWDITEWAKDQGIDTPIITFHDAMGEVPDDCIGVAVGGRNQYKNLILNYTGMLFLTPAVANNWDHHIDHEGDKEWQGCFDTRDEYMKFLFQLGGYKYALRVDTGLGDRENLEASLKSVTEKLELELKDPDSPVATTELATKIYEDAKRPLSL